MRTGHKLRDTVSNHTQGGRGFERRPPGQMKRTEGRDERRWRHGARRVPTDYWRRHDAIVGRVTGCRWR